MKEERGPTVMTAESIAQFRRALEAEERSANTVSQYCRDAARLFTALPPGKELTRENLLRYKESLLADGAAPATVNARLCAVNRYLTFAGLCGLCLKLVRVQREMFRAPERELTKEDYRRLLQAAERKGDRRLLLVMETICATGIRVSELRWVTAEGVRRSQVEVTAKGKTRRLPLPAKLRKALLAWLRERGIQSGPAFVSRRGTPLDRFWVWRNMKALCKEAGVAPGKVFPHNLRHLFARCFYAVKKDLAYLADILGHSSVETTRIYTATSGRELERTLDSLRLLL